MSASADRLRTLLALSLGLFAAGVQVHELFATVGGWLTTALAVAVLAREGRLGAEARALWPLAPFLLWSLVGPLVLGHPPTGTGVARLLDVLMLPGVLWACLLVTEAALLRVAAVASVVLLLSCAAAGLQYLGQWPRSETFSSLWWAQVPTDRVYEPVPGRTDRFMGGGLLLHRLRFANVSAAVTVLAAAGALLVPQRRALFAVVALVGLGAVAVFPHARAATVALVVALLVVAGLGAPTRRLGLLLGGGVATVATLLVVVTPSMRERLISALEANAASDRQLLVSAGLSALAQAPLGGVGLGRFKPGAHVPAEAPEAVRQHQGKTHNQFLTVAAEGGVPALVTLLALLAWVAAQGLRQGRAGAGAMGALVLVVGLSALHDPLFHAESSLALFGALGAGLGLARRAGPRADRQT
ncbi:MAG: O-antigen ligase family protein [Myxococcaceae bacterium]|nr:O-antigen ligase family protein [Myxococcaceae bacterium]